ncbi:MAG: DnaJ domain-containing protein [Phormidesmis sp.]
MNFSSGDYYHRLRVNRTASHQEIKRAFRRLARQYHPDLHPNEPEAIAKFQALREAYEVLADRVQRQRYDQRTTPWNVESDSSSRTGQSSGPSGSPSGSQPTNQSNQRANNGSSTNRPPQTPSDFYIRGIRQAIAHRYSAALKDYTQAIALDPQFAEAYLRRAEVRYLLKDDSGVLADAQAAIALNATEAKTYFYQGLARYRLGYVQSAIAAFDDAITHDADDARYYRWRGNAHQDLNDIEDAAKDFRRAAQRYREQGDIVKYKDMQQTLKSLGTAGRTWPFRLIMRPFDQAVRGSNQPSGESPRQDSSRSSTSNRQPFSKSPTRPPHKRASQKPAPRSSANTRQRDTNANKTNANKQEIAWGRGVSSRPSSKISWRQRLGSSSIGLLKLISNPAGEMVSIYRKLPINSRSAAGYAIAILANLCFVLGALQYFESSSLLLVSRLWATGALTFVAMVLVLSIVRLRLRVQGRWSADIFILGTTLLPIGLLALVSAAIPVLTYYIAEPFGSALTLIGVGFSALWAFSHAMIALHSGLSRIHKFSMQLSAWLTPIILSLGLSSGMVTWLFLVT